MHTKCKYFNNEYKLVIFVLIQYNIFIKQIEIIVYMST